MTQSSPSEIVQLLREVLGVELLEFCFDCSLEDLSLGQLEDVKRENLEALGNLLTDPRAAESVGLTSFPQAVRAHVTFANSEREPLAIQLRAECGGDISVPAPEGSLEQSLVILARDTFPVLLLPEEESPYAPTGSNIEVMRAVLSHPLKDAIADAVANDSTLARAIAQNPGSGGSYPMVFDTTGMGSTLQSETLSLLFIVGAWRERKKIPGQLTIQTFCDLVLRQLAFARAAVEGEAQMVRGRIAFAGVLIPAGQEQVNLSNAVLRSPTEVDRADAPLTLRRTMSGTDSRGVTTEITCDGDVVVEFQLPYRVTVEMIEPGESPSHPQITAWEHVQAVSTRLRLALLLAVRRDPERVQIMPTWRAIDNPLSIGQSLSWSDPQQSGSLMAAQLSQDEFDSWITWYDLLDNPQVERISIAISRIVRASSERRDATDVLIDSVIAWENLFGTKEGEPTLRITASIALLLESDAAKRKKLRSKLARIYGLRSALVHGTALPKPEDFPLCIEALDISIEVLRVVLRSRPDLLAETDGGARSLRLILALGDDPTDSAVGSVAPGTGPQG